MKLELTLDRVEGDKAVLLAADGNIIIWPLAKLPPGAREGQVLAVEVNSAEAIRQERQQTAKEILNEILRPD